MGASNIIMYKAHHNYNNNNIHNTTGDNAGTTMNIDNNMNTKTLTHSTRVVYTKVCGTFISTIDNNTTAGARYDES